MTLETQAAFARRIGHAKSHVTQLKQAGRLVMEGGRVDVEASLQRIEATRASREDVAARHARARNGEAPEPPPETETRADAISRKESAQADIAEMERDQLRGRLVEIDEVRRAGADLGAWLRATVENRTAQLAAQIAAAKDAEQQHALLVEHFEQLLIDYAAQSIGSIKERNLL